MNRYLKILSAAVTLLIACSSCHRDKTRSEQISELLNDKSGRVQLVDSLLTTCPGPDACDTCGMVVKTAWLASCLDTIKGVMESRGITRTGTLSTVPQITKGLQMTYWEHFRMREMLIFLKSAVVNAPCQDIDADKTLKVEVAIGMYTYSYLKKLSDAGHKVDFNRVGRIGVFLLTCPIKMNADSIATRYHDWAQHKKDGAAFTLPDPGDPNNPDDPDSFDFGGLHP